MFRHDELTQKPILDANGNRILREEFYLDGLNCDPLTFDKECEQLNKQYCKNQTYGEIKTHHYILSFDPKDGPECGLTGPKAQALGLEFARKYFPGHQALVCTHMDGHNESGNIHVHIVINSLRKLDVDRTDFMERPCDSRAGFKHHVTDRYFKTLLAGVMEMCRRERLHQVDLLSPAAEKIDDREYRAAQRGQEKLDEKNREIIADGMTPAKTKFQTQKQFLRDAITDTAGTAKSDLEFKRALREKYGIELKESRGRYSYLHPERSKFITGRALGADYEKEHLLALFEENARFASHEKAESKETAIPDEATLTEFDPAFDYAAHPEAILFIRTDLRLVVDLQTNIKAQQSAAYARKVKLSNLKEMAKTVAYVQEHGYADREALSSALESVSGELAAARKTLRATEDRLRVVNEQIHYAGQYLANKSAQQGFLKSRNKKKYHEEHSAELALYDAVVKFFKEHNEGKVPSLKSLKAERDQLQMQREAQTKTYHYFRDYQKELRTVNANVDSILGKEQEHILNREKSPSRF